MISSWSSSAETEAKGQPSDRGAMDASAIRAEIERLLDAYLAVEYFSLRGQEFPVADDSRVLARYFGRRRPPAPMYGAQYSVAPRDCRELTARKAAPETTRVSMPQPFREPQLWKATIARRLAQLPHASQDALLLAAEYRRTVAELRRGVIRVDVVLRSPSTCVQIGKRDTQRLRDLREVSAALADLVATERKRLVLGKRYTEAVFLLWLAISETDWLRDYCLGDFSQYKAPAVS